MAAPVSDREEGMSRETSESGYGSGHSNEAVVSDLYFTSLHLKFLNRQLQHLQPEGTAGGWSDVGGGRKTEDGMG